MDLLVFIIGVVIGALVCYFFLKAKLSLEAKIRVEEYIQQHIEEIREETLKRSRAVLKGKIAEQMVALLPEFPYNPADARFIGNPVDYVIFDGYTQVKDSGGGEVRIIFLDVKKGEKAQLTREEEAIMKAVKEKKVAWHLLHLK
ncbi:MAG: Holliday junction resolvase-like protein [Candidatus Nanoarchaeia archaeon]|nr:endonuclease [Candidatus Haiyanarchaeum thermophilum]MCW1307816.1 endonuclease [Candidatus Haiyanarchaeum thermophilum]MCW1308433.1 endonuclease [Candidatus Haiyanarchaeum thermophilum]